MPRSEELETSSKSKFIAAAVVIVAIGAVGAYTYETSAKAPAAQKVALNEPAPLTPPPAPMTPPPAPTPPDTTPVRDAGTAGPGAAASRIDALHCAGAACRPRERRP